MNNIVEKYEVKLDFLTKNLDNTKHLMDVDTLEIMQDLKVILEEVLSDFKKTNHWIKINKDNKPHENGNYMCFVPDCRSYNKHYDEYYWDGRNFVDNSYIGRGRVVEATHFMVILDPQVEDEKI